MRHQIKLQTRVFYPWKDMKPGDDFIIPEEHWSAGSRLMMNKLLWTIICKRKRDGQSAKTEKYSVKQITQGMVVKRLA